MDYRAEPEPDGQGSQNHEDRDRKQNVASQVSCVHGACIMLQRAVEVRAVEQSPSHVARGFATRSVEAGRPSNHQSSAIALQTSAALSLCLGGRGDETLGAQVHGAYSVHLRGMREYSVEN